MKRRSKHQDWVYKTVSCQIGCSNDCLYCFAKGDIVKKRCKGNKANLKEVPLKDWPKEELSKTGILNKYKLYANPIMCPGTHDITEGSFENTLTMLQRLLMAGNRVLIVSKPRLRFIKKICDELKEYKENIIFLFTIGAMSDEILSFWEPSAPLHTKSERKRYLMLLTTTSGHQ